jgi:hypothetical protein
MEQETVTAESVNPEDPRLDAMRILRQVEAINPNILQLAIERAKNELLVEELAKLRQPAAETPAE